MFVSEKTEEDKDLQFAFSFVFEFAIKIFCFFSALPLSCNFTG